MPHPDRAQGRGSSERRGTNSRDARRLEALRDLLEDLSHLDGESCILVEGRRDMEALRLLGVGARIRCLMRGRGTLLQRLSSLGPGMVCILTDLDSEGRELARQASTILASLGVEADVSAWRSLEKLVRGETSSIEELAPYIARLSERVDKALPRA